jgi:hypothetical protein
MVDLIWRAPRADRRVHAAIRKAHANENAPISQQITQSAAQTLRASAGLRSICAVGSQVKVPACGLFSRPGTRSLEPGVRRNWYLDIFNG